MSTVTQRTAGNVSNSSRRLKPLRPAPSEDAKRPDPMPAFSTETAVPSASNGSLSANRSGQSPSASRLEQAPSVMESPKATIAAAGPADKTCTSYTPNTCRVVEPPDKDDAVT